MTPYAQELAAAREICQHAGALQLAGQSSGFTVNRKDDCSPVTEIDRQCETLIRQRLDQLFPRDGVLGEEQGEHTGSSGRRWIVDPLDGTRPYVRGIPTFSVLLALEHEGRPVVGVIHLPALGITCWAAAGSGAFVNGEPVHVSATAQLQQAMGSALGFVEHADESGARVLRLMRAWDYTYGFMDAYTYVAVASGKLDACVNLLDKPWDCAAAACIVTEAGGRYSDIAGQVTVHNGSFVITNGTLHDAVVAVVSGAPAQ
jgi:histidinol-phosphatase